MFEIHLGIFVFRYLQGLGCTDLIYKPSKADYALYWKEDCIVVTDLISEAPVRESAPHEICLEKLLVDINSLFIHRIKKTILTRRT